MKGIQNTSTESFSTIIGNNKRFMVPKFQRDYSWDYEQWDDLWMDITSMIENHEDDHYMGYLVLQTSDDKIHRIIDGQQRITTIMILILAALRNIQSFIEADIEKEDNQARIDNLVGLYIGKIDPVSLDYDNILVLNRNNNAYYKDYIVKLNSSFVRGLSLTEKLMRKCFLFFDKKLTGLYSSGKGYAQFIQTVVDSLYFTKIVVSDEMNAFRVFETLNARGVQLSSSDLLKNYLFSLVDNAEDHRSRIESLEEKWSKMTDIVKSEKLPEFLRYYWNSKNKAIRSKDVFKTIRSQIKNEAEVFQLINDMIRYSDVYMALLDKNDEMWGTDSELKDLIGLIKLFNLRQPLSTLMSAKLNLPDDLFKKVLKNIIIICFRYNVICDKNPNDQDLPFNSFAISITTNKNADFTLLDKIYVEDNEFERTFAEKEFPYNSRNAKVIRYILGKIDSFNGSPRKVKPDEEDASIEHILPQAYDENWEIDETKAIRLINRLGNLCLLEKSLNQNIQNARYEDKLEAYNNSSYLSATQIYENYHDCWNEESIISRQKRMARVAKTIWSKTF